MGMFTTPEEDALNKELSDLDNKYTEFLEGKEFPKNKVGGYWQSYSSNGKTRLTFEDDIPEDMKADIIAIFDKYLPRQ